MKRSLEYPEWAEKYRAKGRTIRKVRDGYGLYECTSVYVPGQKYPKSKQTYLGMITEKDGFIPKGHSVSSRRQYIEYGLSHFIILNFKRDIMRGVYDLSEDMLLLGIVFFMFGDIDEVFIRSTYLSHDIEDSLLKRIQSGISEKRLVRVSNKINSLLKDKIPDEKDRNMLVKLLFISVIDSQSEPESFLPSQKIREIIERYGLRI